MNLRKLIRRLFIAVVVLVAALAVWSRAGRRPPDTAANLNLSEVHSLGRDTGNGNLLGIQPYMLAADYATEARFHQKLDGYLAAAREKGLIGTKTVVVFPEFLGSWLVVTGEKRTVYEARTVKEAATLIALSNLPSFMSAYLGARARDRMTAALFRMKAREMAGIYQRVFSRLAKDYGVTIVAGSILLPSPQVKDGNLLAGDGPLYNTTVVYGPDGRAREPAVRKVFPTKEEQPFVSPGSVDDLPVFETPAGKLGVLICADSWYPEAYRQLGRLGAELIAVPSLGSAKADAVWQGYSGFPNPEDVDPADVGHLSEGEAWAKYALPGRLPESGARAGVNVFLRGRLWDLTLDGLAFAARGNEGATYRGEDGSIVNVWIGR